MSLIQTLANVQGPSDSPFLISDGHPLTIGEVLSQSSSHLDDVQPGDVVALIGDFDQQSIADLLRLIDRRAVVVPLNASTRNDHDYFFDAAQVDWVIESRSATKRSHDLKSSLLDELRLRDCPGLVLFSTGTTGRPKAILHDMTAFLKRFETPRPTLRTLAFLMFDHIGGLNTLFHTMFNRGLVVTTPDRAVPSVLGTCKQYDVEVLPVTPTFLRMMLMSGLVPDAFPESVKIVTYGTELMDQPTLDALCRVLPGVDFRQTFGMSELGILRVKSKARNSLYMRIGGEGVQTRVDSGNLHIYSPTRMMGYLNADSPFDEAGWFNTNDIVETDGDFIRVVGRTSDVINVGGLKFMASEVERVVLGYPGVQFVTVNAKSNPVTGQHVEITIEPVSGSQLDLAAMQDYLRANLPSHMVPRRIEEAEVSVGHRFKRKR